MIKSAQYYSEINLKAHIHSPDKNNKGGIVMTKQELVIMFEKVFEKPPCFGITLIIDKIEVIILVNNAGNEKKTIHISNGNEPENLFIRHLDFDFSIKTFLSQFFMINNFNILIVVKDDIIPKSKDEFSSLSNLIQQKIAFAIITAILKGIEEIPKELNFTQETIDF